MTAGRQLDRRPYSLGAWAMRREKIAQNELAEQKNHHRRNFWRRFLGVTHHTQPNLGPTFPYTRASF